MSRCICCNRKLSVNDERQRKPDGSPEDLCKVCIRESGAGIYEEGEDLSDFIEWNYDSSPDFNGIDDIGGIEWDEY